MSSRLKDRHKRAVCVYIYNIGHTQDYNTGGVRRKRGSLAIGMQFLMRKAQCFGRRCSDKNTPACIFNLRYCPESSWRLVLVAGRELKRNAPFCWTESYGREKGYFGKNVEGGTMVRIFRWWTKLTRYFDESSLAHPSFLRNRIFFGPFKLSILIKGFKSLKFNSTAINRKSS